MGTYKKPILRHTKLSRLQTFGHQIKVLPNLKLLTSGNSYNQLLYTHMFNVVQVFTFENFQRNP